MKNKYNKTNPNKRKKTASPPIHLVGSNIRYTFSDI